MTEMTAAEADDILTLRRQYYGLLTRLFLREPEPEWLAALEEGLPERADAARLLEPLLGEGWDAMGEFLGAHPFEDAGDDFTRVFLGPYRPEVAAYESHYLTGMLFKEPLIEVRGFMNEVGLEKNDENFPEPEDILAFELEIMSWLLGKEGEATGEEEAERWRGHQALFFKEHLQVWAPTCARDLQEASSPFYKGVGLVLEGFLKLEARTYQNLGPDKVATLEEARRKYSSRGTWRGNTFDPSGNPTQG